MADLNSLSNIDQGTSQQFLSRLGQYNDQYTNAQNQENALARYFARVMSGQGPSVVQQQVNATTDQIARQQQAQTAGTSGVNAVAARREAMQNTANAQAQANQTAAMARTQEQSDAARTAAAIRANQATQAAGLFGANVTGASNFANTAAGTSGKAADIALEQDKQEKQLVGNLTNAGGGLVAAAAASDKNEKKNIEKVSDPEMDAFIKHLAGFTFDYKHPGTDLEKPGHRVGVMAQDVRKGGPMGEAVVINSKPLALDLPNAVGGVMAAVGYLARRVKELESA